MPRLASGPVLLLAVAALLAVPFGPAAFGGVESDLPTPACPDGFEEVGSFKLTAYVLAQEADFPAEPRVADPCGLDGSYSEAFLFGSGVRMQGSGRSADGSIVHYAGRGCFELLDCPRTASGRCATTGRTVAVDRTLIPLGTELWVEGHGLRRAEDTGGAIRGHHLDVWYGDELSMSQARRRTQHDRLVCRKR